MTKGYQAIQHWIAKVHIYLLGESLLYAIMELYV